MQSSALDLSAPRWKVCLIDDEADVREIYTVGLIAEGLEVIVADGGESGLAIVRSNRPDIILLDLQMPDVDGFEVLRALAEDKSISKIPVIILSNTDNEEAFRAAGDFDVVFFFVKSLTNPRKVGGAIREVLGG